jgi:AraC-like DNA-binding protein
VIRTEFSTLGLPAAERYDFWDAMVSQAQVRTRIRCSERDDFPAHSVAADLGEIQIFRQTIPALETTRTPPLIRQHDPGYLQAWFTLGGRTGLSQGDRYTTLGAGGLTLYDTSKPFHGWTAEHGGPGVTGLTIQLPREALPVHPSLLPELILRPIQGSSGVGGLLQRFLLDLLRHSDEYQETDRSRLAGATLDLLGAVLAQETRQQESLAPEAQQRVLRQQVRAHIEQHLGDPGLTPSSIAAAHRISLRYLHRLFQEEPETVAESIRRARLERIHRDLADPRLATRTIQSVAARWGFPEPTHFSRSFRAAYGTAPREHRQQARVGA